MSTVLKRSGRAPSILAQIVWAMEGWNTCCPCSGSAASVQPNSTPCTPPLKTQPYPTTDGSRVWACHRCCKAMPAGYISACASTPSILVAKMVHTVTAGHEHAEAEMHRASAALRLCLHCGSPCAGRHATCPRKSTLHPVHAGNPIQQIVSKVVR